MIEIELLSVGRKGDPGFFPYAEWVPGTFIQNSVVSHENSIWYAIRDTTEEPSLGAIDWVVWVDGTGILADRIAAGVSAAASAASAATSSAQAGAAATSATASAGSATSAATEATNAAASAASALSDKTLAQTARNDAEAAALAAQVAGIFYPNTTAGLAATTNGQYFLVVGDDANTFDILYLHSGASAIEQKRYPSKAMIDALQYASQAEAELGVITNKMTSPATTKAAILFNTNALNTEVINARAGAGSLLGMAQRKGVIRLTNTGGTGTTGAPYTATSPNFTVASIQDDTKFGISLGNNNAQAAPIININALGAITLVAKDGGVIPINGLEAGAWVEFVMRSGIAYVTSDWYNCIGYRNYVSGVVDPSNDMHFGLHQDGIFYPPDLDMPKKDRRNKEWTRRKASREIVRLMSCASARVYFVYYGQSNEQSPESWPAMTGTTAGVDGAGDPDGLTGAYDGNFFIGNDIRPASGDLEKFTANGGSLTFQPMIAKCRDGDVIKTAAQQALLTPGGGFPAEHPSIVATNSLKTRMNLRKGVLTDSGRLFGAGGLGTGGRSIRELSKNNTLTGINYYGRFWRTDGLGGINRFRTLAEAASVTYEIPAIVWIQGESDYLNTGDATNRAEYLVELQNLHTNMVDDVMSTTGQKYPPIFVIVVVGGPYTRDTDPDGNLDLFVAMATWQFAEQTENVYIATPIYPFTDKSNHHDTNGVRWMGAMIEKCLYRVLVERRDFQWLRPIAIERLGRDIYFHMGGAVGKLAWRNSYYDGGVINIVANRGLRFFDAAGVMTNPDVLEFEPGTDTIIHARVPGDPTSKLFVQYAGLTPGSGHGNIFDSDEFEPQVIYKYRAGTGMYAEADNADLNDAPYPGYNACVPFWLPCDGDWRLADV